MNERSLNGLPFHLAVPDFVLITLQDHERMVPGMHHSVCLLKQPAGFDGFYKIGESLAFDEYLVVEQVITGFYLSFFHVELVFVSTECLENAAGFLAMVNLQG